MSDQDAVVVAGLHKSFDDGLVRALDGVDLVVRRGEWLAVTGPSGCGKSTLLHILAALDTASSGTVQVLGRNIAGVRNLAAFRRRSVGLVFQLHDLVPHLTAAQNVQVAMFGTGRGRLARAQRAQELLADVDLAGREHRPPTRLSGGERQRVAIARALANDPPLLLADEPTGNLDSASVELIIDLVRRLRAARPELTVVMVTHDERVAAAADRIVHIKDGRIVPDLSAARS
ncbi:MAG TPA: ABC transporter ATP-binding protein [Mycobacterium sp.]|jgi:putative ABC transport system ATP-binding protein|nr:ABC transporter ATP-binding protein [Mycobacterium sp.]